MEMDLGTAIVGLILIFICVIPFVIMYNNRVKKENKILQLLHEFAQQHNCKISQHEFCGDFVLGIDNSSNFVFFCKQKKEEVIFQFVPLSEVHICQVVKKTRNIKSDMETPSIIDKVELSFIPINKSKEKSRFELYDEETNLQLSGELQFADKWSKQINDCLKNKK